MLASGYLTPAVAEVLAEFRREYGADARLWLRDGRGSWLAFDGSGPGAPGTPPALGDGALPVPTGDDTEARLALADATAEQQAAARFLAHMLERVLRHDRELRAFSREITERYEEITLLYSISEILGATLSLEQAAGTILSEVVGTLGARRAALWVYLPERHRLELAAGVAGEDLRPYVDVDDRTSVTAEVFRERRPVLLEPGEEFPRGEHPSAGAQRGSFLSVPVSYTPPEGESRTVGVISLIGRTSGEPFSAGDLKLVSAIASQIGSAVENSRLVAESVQRERLEREMELAHDLQLKLLPSTRPFRGYAEVAARCAPANSVGGDFYHLFRLPGGRLGVVIGDVSSHGFSAALIMALTMSAVAIHASEGDAPPEVLRRVHRALIDELETTEMYMTLFYGVIDPAAGTLSYANAGHAYAFRVRADGSSERLGATNPPLGIIDLDAYGEAATAWEAGRDVLFLFTDGLSDALGLGEVEGERRLLDEVVRHHDAPVEQTLRRLFALPRAGDSPADDRTAVLVRR